MCVIVCSVELTQSRKLENVCYDIRGPVLDEAKRLEEEGRRIMKLNIGNPAPFGFEAPDEILVDVIRNLPTAQGYSDSRGLLSARTAVVHHYQTRGLDTIDVDDVWLGNGVSELISMSLQAMLDNGDEVLVPAPDYPLWTAATSLAGGRPVHYLCDESAGWQPDVEDLRSKVTPRTKAIVVINPNNPTGAVWNQQSLQQIAAVAQEHGLVVLADEIYDKILYGSATHTPFAVLAPDVLTLTFNGLSKAYRVAGFRSGWMVVSGPTRHAGSYLEGIAILANMRLCANVPAQHAVQVALGGRQSIRELILPGGQAGGAAGRRGRRVAGDPGRLVHRAVRCALRLPAPGPGGLPDQGRPALRAGAAAIPARAGGAGDRIQLAAHRPPAHRDAAARRRAHRRDRAVGAVPGGVPGRPVTPRRQQRKGAAGPTGTGQTADALICMTPVGGSSAVGR